MFLHKVSVSVSCSSHMSYSDKPTAPRFNCPDENRMRKTVLSIFTYLTTLSDEYFLKHVVSNCS